MSLPSESPSAPRAWIACWDGTAAAWQEDERDQSDPNAHNSGRLVQAQSHSMLPSPPAYVQYGGLPGDDAHKVLSASALETMFGFQFCTTLICDRGLIRNLPLDLMPPDESTPLASASTGNESGQQASGVDWKWVKSAIREGWSNPHVFVAPDPHGGHGLFAAAEIPACSLLGEYTGELLRDDGDAIADDYTINFPSMSSMRISALKHGSLMRFLNHEDAESATCSMASVMVDGCIHLCCFTRHRVLPYDALTFNYGPAYWKIRNLKPKTSAQSRSPREHDCT